MNNAKHIEYAFVINLKERTDRMKQFKNNFKNTDLNVVHWDATNGRKLSKKQISDITTEFCRKYCSYGMIGCADSHISIWRHMVKNNLDNVLILEDDSEPINKNEKFKLIDLPNDYDLFYLGCRGSCNLHDLLHQSLNTIIDESLMVPLYAAGTHAYVISLKGAKKFLNSGYFNKINYHVDMSMAIASNKIPDFKLYALIDSKVIPNNQTTKSNLLEYDHPIMNIVTYVPIKIIYTDNEELEQVIYTQILNDRDEKIYISVVTLIICFLGILLSMFGYFHGFLIVLAIIFLTESYLTDKFLGDQYIFEYDLAFIFSFIGYLIYLLTNEQ